MGGGDRVVTLETFIIDTFTRVDKDGVEQSVDQEDQIGGGGTYAILGARVWLPPTRLGMIIDHTPNTLASAMRSQLEAFGKEMWCFRVRDDGLDTCRAVNRYTDNLRVFEYLSPPRYISPKDTLETPWTHPPPSVLHVISELRFLDNHMAEIHDLQRRWTNWEPKIVYEPLPYDCVPEHTEGVRRIAGQVDILSPNHNEALALLSIPEPSPSALRETLELACRQLAEWKPKRGVIIRAGAIGSCYLASHGDAGLNWVPAYWSSDLPDAEKRVVDPTGAGNAFCGALAAALADNLSLDEAVLRGTVAASYMIEQHGIPHLSKNRGEEFWNGDKPGDRLERLRQRLDPTKVASPPIC